jgi:gliding motility-associated-like protein
MKNTDNIEQLFKEKFDGFEADVNPQVWTNVQSGINAGAGGAASVAGKLALGKIIAGVAGAVVLAGSVWYFSSSHDNSTAATAGQDQTQNIASTENTAPQNIASGDQLNNTDRVTNTQSPSNTGSQMPPAIRSLNHYGSDYSEQSQTGSNASKNETTTDAGTSDNNGDASTQPEKHKYGKATVGTGSMMREPEEVSAKEKSTKKKKSAPAENQDSDQALAVNIFASTESGEWPLTVNFSNQGVSTALSWDFGDGNYSKEVSTSHTFNKPGTYVVKLVAQNSKGSNMDKVTIEVKPVSGFEIIPNVFSPNGDGDNDNFVIETKKMASLEVLIMDLSGRIVGGWNTVDGSWNGKLKNGEDAPEGQYFYTFRAMGVDGQDYPTQKGSVTLSRKR